MKSNNLHARAVIEDNELIHARDKKYVEERIMRQLATSLADKLIEDAMDRITVKRDYDPEGYFFRCNPMYYPGSTVYEVDCFVLTPKEYREYQQLKDFQKQMKNLIE